MMMKPPVDSYVFTNTAALKEHYAAVHRRIFDRPQKEKEDPKIHKQILWTGVKVENIISLVASFYKMSIPDLLHGRFTSYVRIRHTAMFLAHYGGKKTMGHIAKVMDVHTNTVCEGVRKIHTRRFHDSVLNDEITQLRAQIEELGKKVQHV